MDPLSITTGIITIAALAGQIGSAFAALRALCKDLPGRLHALNNEVADLEVVLYQVAAVIKERGSLLATDEATISQLLEHANTKLVELKQVIEHLVSVCTNSHAVVLAAAWRKRQAKLQLLQDDMKTIKGSLNIIIGASNSRDMIRVRLNLENLSTITSQSLQEQTALRDTFLNGLALHQDDIKQSLGQSYGNVEQRISRIEELLEAQAEQFQASQSSRLQDLPVRPFVRPRRLSDEEIKRRASRSPARSEGVGVRVTQYATVCRPGCSCACHTQERSATPRLVERVLGQLFVGYAGLPMLNHCCDTSTCEKAQIPHVSVEYWFPLGFCWSQIIRFQIAYQPNSGPHMQLSTLRRVPDSAQCVTFALEGNIDGLKTLFEHGLASPRDVSSTRGYSLLRWALYGQQYDTCKFLVTAGADTQYSPVSPSDDNPANKACDIVLRGGLSREQAEVLRCLTEGNDFIENQSFSPIHKIVLRLSLRDLRETILEDPDNIDIQDAMGRTALEWAAARGDDRSVAILLSCMADPNSMDKKLNTPLTLAANQNHTSCVRLLLEAGADPDPELPNGIKFGTPLNCAARNASDPLLMKTLLDFNADIEASNVDLVTPLLHVARRQTESHAMLLLDYGANINAMSKDGLTALTTSIIYNNHGVLKLLLERWKEYSECPRLKGPHLLELVAQYADVETISILSSTVHFKTSFDRDYALGDFLRRLKERSNVNLKLMEAFEQLLGVIGREPETKAKSVESHMEAGLLRSPHGSHFIDTSGSAEDTSMLSPCSDQSFEDAVESFDASSEEIHFLAQSLKKRATI